MRTLLIILLASACSSSPKTTNPDAGAGVDSTLPDADLTTGQHPADGQYVVQFSLQTLTPGANVCTMALSPRLPWSGAYNNRPTWTDTAAIVNGATTYHATWATWWAGTETFNWKTKWPDVTGGGSLVFQAGGGAGTNPPPVVTITATLTSANGVWESPTAWRDEVTVTGTCSDGGSGGCADPAWNNLPCMSVTTRAWTMR